MKIKTAFVIGARSFWQIGKDSSTASHLKGAVIGIALSLLPLVVVIVVANGMIEGITYRLIEVFTYHLQVPLYESPPQSTELLARLTGLPGVVHAHQELSGSALVRAAGDPSGTKVRAVSPEFLHNDEGFRENLNLNAGGFDLEPVPPFLGRKVFEKRLLARLTDAKQVALLEAVYQYSPREEGYRLPAQIEPAQWDALVTLFSQENYSTVILGEALAEKIDARPGDQIYLLTVRNFHGREIPRSSKFIVTGIFSTGYQDVDRYLLYIPLEVGRRILPPRQSSEYIGIKVSDPFADLRPVIAEVLLLLKEFDVHHGSLRTWDDMQKFQFQSFESTKASLVLIMCVIILVAAVNVYSSIHMLVMGKIREIAILKSMGAKPWTITFSFVFTGFLIGVAGTLAGLLLGLLLAVNINELTFFIERIINFCVMLFSGIFTPASASEPLKTVKILNPDFYLASIPIRISFLEVSFIGLFSIVVSTLASYLPARSAGKVRPLEIIRRY